MGPEMGNEARGGGSRLDDTSLPMYKRTLPATEVGVSGLDHKTVKLTANNIVIAHVEGDYWRLDRNASAGLRLCPEVLERIWVTDVRENPPGIQFMFDLRRGKPRFWAEVGEANGRHSISLEEVGIYDHPKLRELPPLDECIRLHNKLRGSRPHVSLKEVQQLVARIEEMQKGFPLVQPMTSFPTKGKELKRTLANDSKAAQPAHTAHREPDYNYYAGGLASDKNVQSILQAAAGLDSGKLTKPSRQYQSNFPSLLGEGASSSARDPFNVVGYIELLDKLYDLLLSDMRRDDYPAGNSRYYFYR